MEALFQPQTGSPSDEAERVATCALAGLSGVGPRTLDLFREAFGSLTRAIEAGPEAMATTPEVRPGAAESLRAAPDLFARGAWLIRRAKELGLQILLSTDEAYPEPLRRAPGHPPVIYVLGEIPTGPAVAVVGTRKCDDYGRDRTREVVARLVGSGVTVVSGGAKGVDTIAHEHTVALGGRTVAVLALGLDTGEARTHRGWCEKLAKKGAVVSEFALDSGSPNNHFPQRNRTLAGLSGAVIITRGAAGSGAIMTCEAAGKAGRPVFAVPGAIGQSLSVATNGLLAEGKARATIDGSEALVAVGVRPETPVAEAPRQPTRPLAPQAAKVLEALGPAPLHVDELIEITGLSASETLVALSRLELDGLCLARPGKYFLRR